LGMQLFFDWSEEGGTPGLGMLRGRVVRLPKSVKIPHIGWNTIEVRRNHPIVAGISSGSYVYFVHSYYTEVEDERIVISTSEYGVSFPAIVAHKNIIGTQFHPEKSGENGMRLLKNFISLIR